MLGLLATFGVLVVLLIISVYLANSGILRRGSYIGWVFFVAYLVVYIHFAAAWYRHFDVSIFTIFHIVLLIILIYPLGVLGAELFTVTFLPDPSAGLELLRVHTAAERKVVEDDLPGAIEEYEKVLAKNSSDVAARLRMADLCHEAKQYEKAVATYEVLLKKPKGLGVDQHCSALTRLSEIYARHLGKYDKARGVVQMIIDEYPDTEYAKFAKDRLANL
jgi:tetratricopeptide (TPR) repeat protein